MITDAPLGRRALMTARDLIRPVIEKPIARFSRVGDANFVDNSHFPWIAELEESHTSIRGELDGVLADRDQIPTFQDVLPSQQSLTADDQWRTFMFYGYGHRIDDNCRRCPETDRLIRTIPGMTTAFFSILSPGKHIPPHRGFYKGVLRFHLGLIVPDRFQDCRIRVGDGFHAWQEGRGVVFDDTYEHEVWNDTGQERVVLFVDFLRPLPVPLATLNRATVAAISRLPEIRRAARLQRPPD